jgi:hypothetical protein
VIEIPGGESAEEILEAEEVAPRSFADDDPADDAPHEAHAVGEDRRPCPMCGEMIQRNAVKCRFCGEVFDKSMAHILGGQAADTRDPRWGKVRTGLATMYYSIIIIFFAAILIAVAAGIGGAMNAGGPDGAPPPVVLILIGIGGFVVLGAAIGMIVGYVYCAKVPEGSGARGYATGALVCVLGNMAVNFVGSAAQIQSIRLLGSLISIIGWVLFMLFIRTTADYLGNNSLAKSAMRFLIFGASFLGGSIVLGIVAGIGDLPILFGVIGLAIAVAVLFGFVWFMRILQGLMKTIDQRTAAY